MAPLLYLPDSFQAAAKAWQRRLLSDEIQLARSLEAPLLTAKRSSRPWVGRLGKLAVVLGA